MPAPRKILVINGHPDPSPDRFCAALAEAYAQGAAQGGAAVRRLAVGDLDFPLIRTASAFAGPPRDKAILAAQDDVRWADHLVLVHPLWLGGQPALLKGFLEQVLRYGFALPQEGFQLRGLLKGRSLRLIVTMGMPAMAYRVVFGGPGLKALMPAAFFVSGFWPIRTWLIGDVEGPPVKHAAWLARARRLGRKGL